MCIAATCTAGVRVGVGVRVRMRVRIRVKVSVEGSVRARVGCVHGGRLLRWRQREVLGVEPDEAHKELFRLIDEVELLEQHLAGHAWLSLRGQGVWLGLRGGWEAKGCGWG